MATTLGLEAFGLQHWRYDRTGRGYNAGATTLALEPVGVTTLAASSFHLPRIHTDVTRTSVPTFHAYVHVMYVRTYVIANSNDYPCLFGLRESTNR